MLLSLLALMLVLMGSWFSQSQNASVSVGDLWTNQKEAIAQFTTNIAQKVSAAPIDAPSVNVDRIMADVEALSFKRYSDADRQRSRDYILEQLKAAGWTPQLHNFANGGINIVAERPGTDPNSGTILVGAHYDTVEASPGADDNATGVAATLEIARLLGARETPRSLQVIFFDQEELGLLGSLAYAAEPNHLTNLQGVIVMDMLGFACYEPGCQGYPARLPVTPPTDKGDFLAVVGDREHLPLLQTFEYSQHRDLPAVLTLPVPLKGLLTPDTMRSDHSPFWYQGIGAVLVTDTANLRNPNYHRATDTLDKIDRPFFAGAAQLVVNATTAVLESTDSLATVPENSQLSEELAPQPLQDN